MSSTRNFNSPGIFANDATTTIPPTPIAGVAYRDAVSGTADIENGWRYGTRVDSKDWNQIMFLLTNLAQVQDKQGLLGWTNLTDYAVPAIVFGSNGLPYIALQASGPSTAPQDPISSPNFWQQFALSGRAVFNATGTFTVPVAMQLGYIRPTVTVIGGGGGGGRFDNGGGGGGAGGIASGLIDLTGVTSVAVTVGGGGAGRTGSSGAGVTGGTSSFGAFVVASGGQGGSLWQGGGTGSGSSGGTINTGMGNGMPATRHDNPSTTSKYGGGNGGGPGGLGSSAAATGSAGNPATLPGGGGGGGNENGNGASGANGIVIIEW